MIYNGSTYYVRLQMIEVPKATLNKPNFFIFTGGPGAGKTAVLEELARRNYTVIPEVARAIIKAQKAIGGNANHMGDRAVYCDLMLKASIDDFIRCLDRDEPVFFDRGIPDLYSYTQSYCGGVTTSVHEASFQYRYNAQVFVFPAWADIYCHDTERKQSFDEAVKTYFSVKESYADCGYSLLELPKCSVSERVDFILKAI